MRDKKSARKPGGTQRKYGRSAFLGTLAAMFLLSGCGGVGPEERAYPLTVFVDAVPEGYQVIYDMADLAEMTGQSKDSGSGENEGSTGTVYTAETLEEIGERYDAGSQYELDIGHVKALVLGTGLVSEKQKLETVMNWLEGDSDLGRNALVFLAEQPEAVMEKRGELGDSVGVFLNGIYENRENKDRRPVTLDDVFYHWFNDRELPELPVLRTTEKGIEISTDPVQ